MSKDNSDSRLSRARRYPYDIPDRAFTLRGGKAAAFDARDRDGRTAVVGYGSNQAPERLLQKFPGTDAVVPVQRARLADHDVVFAAHLATYGSVPASLRHVPGTVVSVAVTWLDDGQLAAMHATEVATGNYVFARLHGVRLALDDGTVLDEAGVYLGERGHLDVDGGVVALAAVAADGRRLPEMTQDAALEHVRRRLAPDDGLARFVADTVADHGLRRRRIAALQRASIAAARWPEVTVEAG